MPKTCEYCKRSFIPTRNHPHYKTCSKKCRKMLKKQRMYTPLKLNEYVIDKINFVIYDLQSNKINIKQKIEYLCESCKNIFVAEIRDQKTKEFKWVCRKCATKAAWQKDQYKKSHVDGCIKSFTPERIEYCRNHFNKLWATPSFRRKVLKEVLQNKEVKAKALHFSHMARRLRYTVSETI